MKIDKKFNYVPKTITPYHKDIKCAISEKIDTKNYNVTIDSDPVENMVYLELGYDNDENFDSAFYINTKQAYDLGLRLMTIAKDTGYENELVEKAKYFVNTLNLLITYNLLKELEIEFDHLYTTDPEDSLFGTIVINVKYVDIYGNSNEASILSDNMISVEPNEYDNLENELKEKYNIEKVSVNNLKFELLKNMIDKAKDTWINRSSNIKSKPIPKCYQPVEELAKSILSNIKKEG